MFYFQKTKYFGDSDFLRIFFENDTIFIFVSILLLFSFITDPKLFESLFRLLRKSQQPTRGHK
jgi:hypothetical protein